MDGRRVSAGSSYSLWIRIRAVIQSRDVAYRRCAYMRTLTLLTHWHVAGSRVGHAASAWHSHDRAWDALFELGRLISEC